MGKNELNASRKAELSELAAFYVDTYCSQAMAVDPVMIAKGLGLPFTANDYGGHFDGYLEYFGRSFHVFLHLNEGDHLYSPRVRFSFAHELGHYLIDTHRRALMEPGIGGHGSQGVFASDIETEREADYFAACLLMPDKWFCMDVQGRRFNATLINEVSRKYNVSFTAAIMRFMDVGNHPVMVVCSVKGKYKWMRYSSDFPFYRLRLEADKSIPDCTAAAEYFTDGTKYNKAERVFAEDWFVLWNSRDQRRRFNEYCIYYDRLDQVVSLIWE